MSITNRHTRDPKLASTCSCRLAIPAPRSYKVPCPKRLNFSRHLKSIRAVAFDWPRSTLFLNNSVVTFTSKQSSQRETDLNFTCRCAPHCHRQTSHQRLFRKTALGRARDAQGNGPNNKDP